MIKLDQYGEALNGTETYKAIADVIVKGASMMIGWTDGEGSHYDIMFTRGAIVPMINRQTIQGGIRPATDLFVSIMRKGAFGFDVNTTWSSPGYFGEKLSLKDDGFTTIEKLTELINGVKYALHQLSSNENQ